MRWDINGVYWHRIVGVGVLHVVAAYGCLGPITLSNILLCVGLYVVQAFGVTAGYHCYFSHRAFRIGRFSQLVLAFVAQSSGLGGVLRWAAYHRYHHRHSDTENDLHSPVARSLWYAHLGWVFNSKPDGNVNFRLRDFEKYPELLRLNQLGRLPMYVVAVACLPLGLQPACFVFGVSSVLVQHATFSVNSIAHRWGARPYTTRDKSRNNWFVALIMLGGGWHNNHHHYPGSARQGFMWWEIDPTYYTLKLLEVFGLVWDIREPPPSVLAARRAG